MKNNISTKRSVSKKFTKTKSFDKKFTKTTTKEYVKNAINETLLTKLKKFFLKIFGKKEKIPDYDIKDRIELELYNENLKSTGIFDPDSWFIMTWKIF